MRHWLSALAASALLASPLCAQQRSTGADDSPKAAESTPEKTASAENGASVAPAVRSLFALPAPRPTPFPAAAASKQEEPPGRLVPEYETAVGYSYVHFLPGDPFDSFGSHGATGSFTYNASKWLGLTGEIGSYKFHRNAGTGNIGGNFISYLFGPRLNLRRLDYFVPFGEFLFGGANGGQELVGGATQNAFALATGGGVDVVLSKNLAWRFAQLDYLMTSFSGTSVGPNARQNSFRVGSGLVLRWGFPKAPPPPVNRPPIASCSVNPTSVYEGSGAVVAVHVNASDPDNDPLTYSYSATGGTVEGTGPDARWNTAGLGVGTYTVTAKVDDGRGGVASCSADVRVEEKPHHPPTVSCAPERSSIVAGERTAISSTAGSPDNLPLTYSYSATGGQISGSGARVEFDSAGLQPGSYTVKCGVTDSRGDKADASTTVEVREPPQVKQLEVKLALHSVYFPTAQPTVAKPEGGLLASQAATLDTLASDFKQYLAYRPNAHLILEGHADSRGPKEYNIKLSERRVARVKSYLVEHGVPEDHLETKAFGFEKNLTDAEVRALIERDEQITAAEKQKILKNLLTVRLANNRRVDVTLTTTGESSVRRFPFSAKDALTLLGRGGTTKGKPKTPAPKKPAKP